VIGTSGSGKSTLIQHLNGLLAPTYGKVYFDGCLINNTKQTLIDARKRIGIVFQMAEEHFFCESVFDEIAFAPRNYGFDQSVIGANVYDALRLVDLEPEIFMQRHPFNLSAGQKRLVAIAAVLSAKPEVLILDEPTASLDHRSRVKLFQLLVDLNVDMGITIIIATHHLENVATLANKAIVLHKGKLNKQGLAKDILSDKKLMSESGLALPVVTDLMHELAAKNVPVRTNVFTLAEARDEIHRCKRRNIDEK